MAADEDGGRALDLGIDAATFARHLDALGVRGLPGLGTVVRFVTYRGISEADVITAAEAVEAVLFLLAGATYTTGHVLRVDGGRGLA